MPESASAPSESVSDALMNKPFSQACENNQAPIAEVLTRVFRQAHRILEIGSGTGQHAVFMAQRMPHLQWQASDRSENLPGINQWLTEAALANLPPTLELDATWSTWPQYAFDGLFSANTAHIMPWPTVCHMIAKVGALLPPEGKFALYGPFNYKGEFTSESNRRFDLYLKQAAAHQGLRDFEKLVAIADSAGLTLAEDNPMPANNRLLVWRKAA